MSGDEGTDRVLGRSLGWNAQRNLPFASDTEAGASMERGKET